MDRLTPTEREAIRALYEQRLKEGLPEHRTAGWGSPESQRLRFEVLLRGLDPRGRSILDVGCGLGALVDHLEGVTGGDFDYLGLDLAPALVEEARARRGGPRRRFEHADLLDDDRPAETFDLVLLSGALTARTADNEGHAQALLRRMFDRCRMAACANFLSTYVDWQEERNHHYSPEAMFAFGRTVTRWVDLHHDYPLYEFTLQLLRSPR